MKKNIHIGKKLISFFMVLIISLNICVLPMNIGSSEMNVVEASASSVIEAAITWAVNIANDSSHGYSQSNRWGPDYDCSSFVISAFKNAGIDTGTASNTANMKSQFTQHGFTCISFDKSKLQRGDILLASAHTEIYIGNNQNVGAHSDRGHPETGDQSNEISVGSYWDDSWIYILRYTGGSVDATGCVDSVTGGVGKVTFRGWAFDRDCTSSQLAIHVYVDGPAGSGTFFTNFTASTSRTDVNTAYSGVGNYHGFDYTASTTLTGTHKFYIYAIGVDKNGNTGENNPLIGTMTTTISADKTKPVISNVKITNVGVTGYTVTCTVTDNVAIDKVLFPTWRTRDGSSGCTWYEGTKNGNTYTFKFTGATYDDNYMTHIYAYDASGNYVCYGCGNVLCAQTSSPATVVDNGVYEIETKRDSSYVFDVDGNSDSSGTNVFLYERNNTSAQRFKFVLADSSGYYMIYHYGTNQVLTVKNGGTGANVNLEQSTATGSDNQLFKLIYYGNGYYYIISKYGQYIDLKGGVATNAQNIKMEGFDASNINNRLWKLNFIECTVHDYIDTIVDPTVELEGYTNHICKVCGYSYKDNYQEKLIMENDNDVTNTNTDTDTDTDNTDASNTGGNSDTDTEGDTDTSTDEAGTETGENNDSTGTNTGTDSTGTTNSGNINTGTSSSTGNSGNNDIGSSNTNTNTDTNTNTSNTTDNTSTNISSSVTVGSTCTVGDFTYKVTKTSIGSIGTVTLIGVANDKKNVTIPANVKIDGKTYKVTAIAKNAFKGNTKMTTLVIGANIRTIGDSAFSGCTKLKKVTIGKSVTKIGKKAFYNCNKLSNITIKSKKLKTSNVGKKAFSKVKATVKIKVPKAKLKAYKRMLYKKGVSNKATIK